MIDEISSLPQVILATVDYGKYQSEEHKKAKVTFLNRKNALLCEEDYYKYKGEIEGMRKQEGSEQGRVYTRPVKRKSMTLYFVYYSNAILVPDTSKCS